MHCSLLTALSPNLANQRIAQFRPAGLNIPQAGLHPVRAMLAQHGTCAREPMYMALVGSSLTWQLMLFLPKHSVASAMDASTTSGVTTHELIMADHGHDAEGLNAVGGRMEGHVGGRYDASCRCNCRRRRRSA